MLNLSTINQARLFVLHSREDDAGVVRRTEGRLVDRDRRLRQATTGPVLPTVRSGDLSNQPV